tara:strand:- start:539 stop:733 length:195 start_codon:yes stop_codon:yes gene_type:complete
MSKVECPNCKELREPFKNYWCDSCVSDIKTKNKHSKERFKRNPSPCDSKLADKELKKELGEVWD